MYEPYWPTGDTKELEFDDIMPFVNGVAGRYDEQIKYEAIIRWTKGKETERIRYFEELFGLLDLSQLPIDFVQSTIRNEEIVKYSLACSQSIIDAFYAHSKRLMTFTGGYQEKSKTRSTQ